MAAVNPACSCGGPCQTGHLLGQGPGQSPGMLTLAGGSLPAVSACPGQVAFMASPGSGAWQNLHWEFQWRFSRALAASA